MANELIIKNGLIVDSGGVQITGSLTTTGSNKLIGDTSLTGSLSITGSTLQIGNNTLLGNTILGGNIIISGSSTIQGTTTMTGSLLITGSTTQIGNNTLLGDTLLSGSITISGSFPVGSLSSSVNIYGDTTMTGYLKFNPKSTNIDTSLTASYIFVSGSTNDLYFSQNGNGYANTTRLRWLEGNLYTGLLHGGVLSVSSSTVYNVSSGSGIIVALNGSYNDNPYPTVNYVNWGNISASIAPLSASFDQSFVAINSSSAIEVKGTPFEDGEYNTKIPLGIVVHQNHSTINAVQTFPSLGYGWKQRSFDFIKAFGPLKISGYTLSPSGSSTGGLVLAGGVSWVDGRNYTIDPNNPSYITEAVGITTSKIYRYYQSGSQWAYDTNGGAGYTSIDPTQYSNSGSLTPVGTNDWSIQRVYYFPNSGTKAFYIYYGNATYSTQALATAAITTEAFTEAPNTAANAIFIGYMLLRHNASFTNASSYAIQAAGLFRASGTSGGGGGGGGGGTSITLQTNGTNNGSQTTLNLKQGSNVTLSDDGIGGVTISSIGSGGSGGNAATSSYGSFFSTATQLNGGVGTSNSMSFNNTDISNGVSISGSENTKIKIATPGEYDLQFSAQLNRSTGGTTSQANIWLSKNGTNVSSSNTALEIPGGTSKYTVAAWNWFVAASAGDYYEIRWAAPDVDVQLVAVPTPVYGPDVPSVILTVNRVDIAGSNTGSFQGSFSGSFTGSISSAISASYALTASYFIETDPVFTAKSSSLATTGSNIFIGNQIITGSLDVSGSVTGSNIRATSTIFSPTITYSNILSTNGGEMRLAQSTIRLNNSSTIQWSDTSDSNQTRNIGLRRYATGTLEVYDGTTNTGLEANRRDLLARTLSGSSLYISGSSTMSGSLNVTQGITGSLFGTASQSVSSSYALTASYALNAGGATVDTGSLLTTASFNSYTSSNTSQFAGTASYALTASYLTGYVSPFPYTGSALITGSLEIIGSLSNGISNLALGQSSHAEGYYTTSSGVYSHAEGWYTQTIGTGSHAEGASTVSLGNFSHTEGTSTKTQGYGSHAEGDSTVTLGQSSHAEGSYTSASGDYSHAEGARTTAFNRGSHAEGSYTYAAGDYAHTEGLYAYASGYASHAEGYYTSASADYQHVQGQFNATSSELSAFIVGNGTDGGNRSNLIYAYGTTPNGVVEVTGSLRVSGSITGSLFGTASYATTASYALNAGAGAGFPYSGSAVITGSLLVSGSGLTVTGSLRISGSITGSLFGTASNAQTASFALSSSNFVITSTLRLDNTLTDYKTATSVTTEDLNLFNQATGSYTSAFVKYTLLNGTNARAGEFVTVWNGTTVANYDNSTTDIGNTSTIALKSAIVAGAIKIDAAVTAGWTVRALATFI